MSADRMKKKAKQICFDRFIDSLFANVVPVINNHSIQRFCCSLCVPNGINLQFVCWNKHDQLETLTRSSVFIRAEAKVPEPTTAVPAAHVPTEPPTDRTPPVKGNSTTGKI